jgi:hypothetical protein
MLGTLLPNPSQILGSVPHYQASTDCQSDICCFFSVSFRPRRHVKKQGGQVPASVVAGIYLQKKKMYVHHSINFLGTS